jgi:hypothetical protein
VPVLDEDDERDALPATHAAMLFCMRLWVIEMRRAPGVEPRIQEMLDQLGAAAAAPHLKRFMFALSRGSTRMIEVRCTCKPGVGADEQALLDVLSLAQAIRPFEAILVLRGFVTQAGAQIALDAAEGVGNALAQAGHFLQAPEEPVRQYGLAPASGECRPAYRTLH